MKRDDLIHTTLEQIDWEFVLAAFKNLKLSWYEKRFPVKSDLVNDLVSIINNAFEHPNVEIVTEYWMVIYIEEENGTRNLEVVFTPIVVLSSSSSKANKLEKRIEELKHRIELHKELEEYERCSKIQKQLAKLEKQLVNKN